MFLITTHCIYLTAVSYVCVFAEDILLYMSGDVGLESQEAGTEVMLKGYIGRAGVSKGLVLEGRKGVG